MNLRDEILQYANDENNQPVSIQEIAQYAHRLHSREMGAVFHLLADIREAAGDPLGNLMQDELVERIARTFGVFELIFAELDSGRNPLNKNGDAPGHSHCIAGVWDSDNGVLAGTPCAWCATWRRARELMDEMK